MGTGEGHGVQLPAVYRHNHGTGFLCLGGKALQALVGVAVGDEDLVDGAAAFQSLGDGIPALQLAFNFLIFLLLGEAIGPAGRRFPSCGTAVFIHNSISCSIHNNRR